MNRTGGMVEQRQPRRGEPPRWANVVNEAPNPLAGVRQLNYDEIVPKETADRIDRQHQRDRRNADDWHTIGYTTAVMARALLVFMLGFAVCYILIGL